MYASLLMRGCYGDAGCNSISGWFIILFIAVPIIGFILNGILSLFEKKPEPLVCATCKQVVYELPGASTTCGPCHDKAKPPRSDMTRPPLGWSRPKGV